MTSKTARPWARDYFKREGTVATWWDPLSPEDPLFRTRYRNQTEDLVAVCKPAGKLVLDAATGRGRAAIDFARAGASRVVAVDISEEMLSLARKNAQGSMEDPPVQFMRGDLVRLPLRSNTFDVVLLLETLLHLPVPTRALGELHRVIRPGGLIMISTIGANPIARLSQPPRRGRHASPPWKLFLATGVNEVMTALFGFCWSRTQPTSWLYRQFFNAPVRPMYPWQVRRMLREAGFSAIYHSAGPRHLLPWEHRWLAIKT